MGMERKVKKIPLQETIFMDEKTEASSKLKIGKASWIMGYQKNFSE